MDNNLLQQESVKLSPLKQINFKTLSLKYGVVVAFLTLIVVSSFLYTGFLNPTNIFNMLSQLAIIGIMAAGMTYVMITGGLDMSVGGIYAATAVVAASLVDTSSILVAVLVGLCVGLVSGLINGVLVTTLKVPPFVATLGTGSVFTGFALVYSNAQPFFVKNPDYKFFGSHYIGAIPVSVIIMFVIFIILGIALAYTLYGKSLYAVGGNKEASHLAGLKTNKLILSTYMISGLCASISGIILSSRLAQGQANIGASITLDVIAAVVIGGTSLSGGQGAIWRTFIGGSILIMISNVLDSLSISSYWQQIFKGSIIIIAVMIDFYGRNYLQNKGGS
ncbi:ABC transporter permease [Lysinibacillus sp. BW-2-10]|uniref:ABC transporter permease n=1 Tax=Lysinibacillus sp. BW-2-10 TaxID=2590030 RepID=UPI001180BB29|nr:ABC transporter permease [Lysinibacillus sp. BW-2-10]TSI07891.1 ABC transporter permease [Lysinibacillus sp. BW-2-10]